MKVDQLSGIVERITFINEENGFSVLKIKSKEHPELVTVVGSMAVVNIGSVVSLQGEWKHDQKYGKQFNVRWYTETVPATIAGLEKYLGSGLIKGIGPVNARRIVKKFREKTIQVIETVPDKLGEVEGIGQKRVEMIKLAWQEQREIKNVMLFLQSHGVSTTYAVKIFKTYGDNSIHLVKENPFRLADDIWGIGFKTADGIARNMGYDPGSYERCRAGTIYVLNQLANDGHCFATREQLIKEAAALLAVAEQKIDDTIANMLADQSLVLESDCALYLPPFYFAEQGVARKIKKIVAHGSKYQVLNVQPIIARVQQENRVNYDQVQVEAISQAVCSKLMVLTGGPGTGKTTTTLAIINVFEKLGARVLLAAPTGRAAKRMAEATGREAKTLHRLLEFKPPQGFQKNSDNPLKCDVLIIDETSMVDLILMYNLLKAVPEETVVILVGDVDQLPSVGAGNVLRDIIESGAVPVVRLTRIFRQAEGSMIITNAHRINKGEFLVFQGGRHRDFFFIQEEEPAKIVEQIVSLCSKRLPRHYQVDPIDDIQLICPMNRGEVGARNLNQVLQQTLNPAKIFIQYNGIEYRLRDKVMQIKNNYEKNVYNGDLGRIKRIDPEDRVVEIVFEGQSVKYDVAELDEVVLAYAMTVHKSQGSEYKVVVAPFTMQHYLMLQRNLLYTCVTRAKQVMVLVGSKKALAIAIRNNKITQRNTLLAGKLQTLET